MNSTTTINHPHSAVVSVAVVITVVAVITFITTEKGAINVRPIKAGKSTNKPWEKIIKENVSDINSLNRAFNTISPLMCKFNQSNKNHSRIIR
jgi:hypothetical protein